MRFLPNPHWVPHLRPQTGRDEQVSDYVLGRSGAAEFLDRYAELLGSMADGYLREGKRFVTVGVGCTGGKHRSVAMSEALAARLRERGVDTIVVHRDLGREMIVRRGPPKRVPRSSPSARGHGLVALLSALRRVSGRLTAVATVADDGVEWSPGRELGVLHQATCGWHQPHCAHGRRVGPNLGPRPAAPVRKQGELHNHAGWAICSSWRCGSCLAATSKASTGWRACWVRRAGCCRCRRRR